MEKVNGEMKKFKRVMQRREYFLVRKKAWKEQYLKEDRKLKEMVKKDDDRVDKE